MNSLCCKFHLPISKPCSHPEFAWITSPALSSLSSVKEENKIHKTFPETFKVLWQGKKSILNKYQWKNEAQKQHLWGKIWSFRVDAPNFLLGISLISSGLVLGWMGCVLHELKIKSHSQICIFISKFPPGYSLLSIGYTPEVLGNPSGPWNC